MIQNMINPKSVQQVLHVVPAVSNEMLDAIELWEDMYKDEAPWLKEPTSADPTQVLSLGLPAFIASEKARMAVMEMQFDITPVTVTPEDIKEQQNNNENKQNNEENNQDTKQIDKALEGVEEEADTPNEEDVKPLYGSEVPEEVTQGNTEKAEYLAEEIKKLKKDLRRQLEYGVAKGGFVIKPYVVMPEKDET